MDNSTCMLMLNIYYMGNTSSCIVPLPKARADPGFEVRGGAKWIGKFEGGDLDKYIKNTIIIIYDISDYDIFQIRFLIKSALAREPFINMD